MAKTPRLTEVFVVKEYGVFGKAADWVGSKLGNTGSKVRSAVNKVSGSASEAFIRAWNKAAASVKRQTGTDREIIKDLNTALKWIRNDEYQNTTFYKDIALYALTASNSAVDMSGYQDKSSDKMQAWTDKHSQGIDPNDSRAGEKTFGGAGAGMDELQRIRVAIERAYNIDDATKATWGDDPNQKGKLNTFD